MSRKAHPHIGRLGMIGRRGCQNAGPGSGVERGIVDIDSTGSHHDQSRRDPTDLFDHGINRLRGEFLQHGI